MRAALVPFALIALLLASPLLAAGPAPSAVVVESSGGFSLPEIAELLETQGARITHRLPPDLLVGQLPAGLLESSELPRGVSLLPLLDPAARPKSRALGGVRRFLDAESRLPSPPLPLPEPLRGDAITPDPDEFVMPKALRECERPAATSAFLAGSVSVGLILPESTNPPVDPNLEDWSAEDPAHPGESRLDLVVAEVMQGLDFLAAEHPEAGLSFSYDLQLALRIDREPIAWNASERLTWMGPTMAALGYEGPSVTSSVRRYVDDLRERDDSDWGFAAFVIDSLNDADGAPPNGFPFAYALLGGPYMVMTYDNAGWGINRMDVVTSHETGHVFLALDEYRAAGNTCAARSGYLSVENANNDSAPGDPNCTPTPDSSCVMRAASGSVCAFTTGQLGLRDSDGNGIPDVRDAPPHSSFDAEGPLLLGVDEATLGGLVTARSLPEESPHAPTTYTVNRVASAEWRLDGGAWTALPAEDGAHGGRCERVSIELLGLAEGWHELELRGTNDLGLIEPSPALLRLYVNTDCLDDAAEPDDSQAEARPRPAGSFAGLYHCAFDEDWSRFYLEAGAALDVQVAFDTAAATLSAELRGPSGSILASSSPTPEGAAFSAIAGLAGTHHLIVRGEGEDEGGYSLVIDAECLNDSREPNELPGEARLLLPGRHVDFVICPGDLDHHAISVQAGESIGATLEFEHALGDLDLVLLDPAGLQVAESAGTLDGEAILLPATEEGVYSLVVFGRGPADSNLHAIELLVSGCLDDLRENDDDPLDARLIAGGEVVRGTLCGDDEDWFAFIIAETSLVEIDLSHDPVGELDLELRDSSGATLLAGSNRLARAEDITVERLLPGEYRLRVLSPLGEEADYTLHLQVNDPVLLLVAKDPGDALLSWSDAGQECYWVRRSEDVSDFSGAIETLIQDGAEFVEDRSHRDVGVIVDRVALYGYLVEPGDCGRGLLSSTKTATPHPVVEAGAGTAPSIEYTITALNGGREDLFGVRIEDDIPAFTGAFEVLEIPAGATDASEPPPAGAFNAGRLVVEGVNVPAQGTAVVRFRVGVFASVSGNAGPLIDNQGRLLVPSEDPTSPAEVFLTDDPATSAFPDDTRVHPGGYSRELKVTAFWHRDVDLNLRVIDPCGNAISVEDAMSVSCLGVTGSMTGSWSCGGGPWFNRAEQVTWFGWPAPAGTYSVELSYLGASDDTDLCRGRGEEQVTVVVQSPSFGLLSRTVTLDQGGGFVRVLDFEP